MMGICGGISFFYSFFSDWVLPVILFSYDYRVSGVYGDDVPGIILLLWLCGMWLCLVYEYTSIYLIYVEWSCYY